MVLVLYLGVRGVELVGSRGEEEGANGLAFRRPGLEQCLGQRGSRVVVVLVLPSLEEGFETLELVENHKVWFECLHAGFCEQATHVCNEPISP